MGSIKSSYEDIIIKPLVTEKSNSQMAEGKYTFIVHPKATKVEIKHAIEKLLGVKVLKVYTSNYFGKNKRLGVHAGKRPDYKKAIVKIGLDTKTETYIAENGKEVVLNKKYRTSIDEIGITQ